MAIGPNVAEVDGTMRTSLTLGPNQTRRGTLEIARVQVIGKVQLVRPHRNGQHKPGLRLRLEPGRRRHPSGPLKRRAPQLRRGQRRRVLPRREVRLPKHVLLPAVVVPQPDRAPSVAPTSRSAAAQAS